MAGTAERILAIKLLGDVSDINKSMRKTEGRLKSMGRAGVAWGKAFTLSLAIEGVEKLGDVIGDAWAGFREGEKASAQLATTWGNLGKDGDALAGVIDAISESTLKLGTDDTEAINAFNTALKTTGGDSAQAMKRLRIAQDLVANGSAPNLASALTIVQQAYKGSARAVDKFGLTAKTGAGRVNELGRKVRGAGKAAADADPARVFFNEVNEALEGIVGSISKGDLEGAMESLTGIGTALGEAWAKVGPGITEVFDKLSGGAFSDVMTKLRELGDTVGPKVAGVIGAMSAAWVAIQPILSQVLTFIQPVVDLLGGALAGGLAFVLDSVTVALQTVSDLLRGDFSGALLTISEGIGTLATDFDTFFVGLPGKIAGWAVDITEEASLLGQSIFHGIQDWVAKLPGRIAEIVGRLAVGIANVWNSLGKFDAGGFTFAEAFDIEIAGQHFGWPKIAIAWGAGDLIPDIAVPEMAAGGIVKKRPGGMLARIGEGAHDEAVIPLDGRGMGGGSTYNITINAGVGSDPAAIGRAVTQALKAYKNSGGGPAMRAAIGA